jgi:putative membrane protein
MFKRFLHGFVVNALAVLLAARVVHGITHDGWGSLLGAALVLGVLNAFIKPVLSLFSLPFLVLTLGLFMTVINAMLLWLTGYLVRGFDVDGFWPAFFGGLIVSACSLFLGPSKHRKQETLHINVGGEPARPSARPRGDQDVIDV